MTRFASVSARTLGLLVAHVWIGGSVWAAAPTEFSWPQWDGPEGLGISAETKWSASGADEALWSAKLGLGYSAVVVKDGRLITMGYDKESGLDTVFCFEALTGKSLWSHSYPSKIWDRAHEGGTVNTPVFDGDVVYSLNREGNLYCFQAEDGEILWHTMLKPEDNPHQLEYPTWGFSGSPLVLEDSLIVNCGRMLSLDKESGEVLWASDDYGHGYGTPILFDLDGDPMLAAMNGRGLGIVSVENGIDLYFHEFTGTTRGVNAVTPVMLEDDLFICSGTKPGCARVAVGVDDLEVVWENREMVNSFSGCIAMDDHLFGFDGAMLKCVDPEGNAKWEQRGIGNGSILGAGDRLLVMSGDGELIVAEANTEKYVELSKAKLFDEGRFWTKPVLVNGVIYCRSSNGDFVARDHRLSSSEG